MAVKELHESQSFEVTQDGITARRVFTCLWSERFTAGDIPQVGDLWTAELPPDAVAMRAALMCTAVRFSRYGAEHCHVEAEYRSIFPTGQQLREDSSGVRVSHGAEVLQFTDDEGNDIRYIIPTAAISISMRVSASQLSRIARYIGCVNRSAFLGLPKWTVLYHGADQVKVGGYAPGRRLASGVWIVEHRFEYRRDGWNTGYSPSGRRFTYDAEHRYPEADLNALV